MEQEMRIAAEIQQALLPKAGRSGVFFKAAAASLPCRSIGGDFYDYVDLSNHQIYGIRSLGKDNAASNSSTYTAGTQTKSFDCDIVYSMGSFVQWPEGMQTQ